MTALPEGVHLDLDPSVRTFRGGTVLTGGFPGRLLMLRPEGVEALGRLIGEGPLSEGDRRLGRRLVAAGMAHPRLGAVGRRGADPDGTVVVPVRDRPAALDECLAALGRRWPVVVVDDGSEDPAAVAAVCDRHGARLLRRPVNGGPGAARNDGLAAAGTELVALVDSDCTVTDGWLDVLTPLFDDPELGAVAPRVRPRVEAGTDPALAQFAEAHSPLDMGPERGEVGPGRRIRYVPAAALVARRAALAAGFDDELRVGEDVDLIWRLHDAGWRVRYEPSVTAGHTEPTSWPAWLRRRFRYGTSAAPLDRRHSGRLAPVELRAWPLVVVVAVLARRPVTAASLVLASAALTFRTVRRRGIPFRTTVRWSATSAGWTLVGAGRASTVLAAPALLVVAGRRGRAGWAARVLLVGPAVVEWWRGRPGLDPVRWVLASVADDAAYGAGVWVGCLRSGSVGPLLPALRARQWDSDPDRTDDGRFAEPASA